MGGQVSKESDKLRSSGDKLAWKATHAKHTKHKTTIYVNTIQIQNTKNTEW